MSSELIDRAPRGSDLLLDRSGGDGLVESPFEGADEPGVAGKADAGGPFVDSGDEFVGDSERHLLHTDTVSDLITDNRSDTVSGMTTNRYSAHSKTAEDGGTEVALVYPTAVNWSGDLRALTYEQLNDRVRALALSIANEAMWGRPFSNGVVQKYRDATGEQDRRVFGEAR
jgi:hypothetical protein